MTALILGTAQFGAGYGITNAVGRLDDDQVHEIVTTATSLGINLFDTAPDYGDAQSRLGSFDEGAGSRRYISKFALPSDSVERLDSGVLITQTLAVLRVSALYGLLFHRTSDLRDVRAEQTWDVLSESRASGLTARIGASIYDADDLVLVADRFPDLDLIQIPGNIIDRRLLDHPVLRELHSRGVEIHVRSAYLQGLLLTQPEAIPEDLAGLRPVVASLGAIAREHGVSMLEIALAFLKSHELVDAVLVGALSPSELSNTAAAWDRTHSLSLEFEPPALDAELLDPRQWNMRVSS
jgi:aryl-alcohol dehydrogenase-like predicted oxidoreductase